MPKNPTESINFSDVRQDIEIFQRYLLFQEAIQAIVIDHYEIPLRDILRSLEIIEQYAMLQEAVKVLTYRLMYTSIAYKMTWRNWQRSIKTSPRHAELEVQQHEQRERELSLMGSRTEGIKDALRIVNEHLVVVKKTVLYGTRNFSSLDTPERQQSPPRQNTPASQQRTNGLADAINLFDRSQLRHIFQGNRLVNRPNGL